MLSSTEIELLKNALLRTSVAVVCGCIAVAFLMCIIKQNKRLYAM